MREEDSPGISPISQDIRNKQIQNIGKSVVSDKRTVLGCPLYLGTKGTKSHRIYSYRLMGQSQGILDIYDRSHSKIQEILKQPVKQCSYLVKQSGNLAGCMYGWLSPLVAVIQKHQLSCVARRFFLTYIKGVLKCLWHKLRKMSGYQTLKRNRLSNVPAWLSSQTCTTWPVSYIQGQLSESFSVHSSVQLAFQ